MTGATGFIGGTILDHFLKCPNFKNLSFSILARDDDRAKQLQADGLKLYTMKNLDDFDAISKAASEHDVVIGAVSGYHTGSAKAIIDGLSKRKQQTGEEVKYIHTDGTSNLADKPISGLYKEDRTFSDKDSDIYAYMKKRNEDDAYPQRTTALTVVEDGKSKGVLTTIIMSPTIYGVGSGKFNRLSIQYPIQMRAAIKDGHAGYIGNGAGQWDYVHVQDLAELYEHVLYDFVTGAGKAPSGEKGILFSETGYFTWKEVGENIQKAAIELGALSGGEAKSFSLKEGADKWLGGNEQIAELGFASNSRTKAEIGKELGWKPKKTKKDWEQAFRDEMKEVISTGDQGKIPGT